MTADVQHIDDALRTLHHWPVELGDFSDQLNYSTVECRGRVGDFPLDHLKQLGRAGHRIELTVRKGSWEARFVIPGVAVLQLASVTGAWDEAFADGPTLETAKSAAEEGRPEILLQLSEPHAAEARVVIRNNPMQTKLHWIRTESALRSSLEGDGWIDVVRALFSALTPQRLVVQDASSTHLTTAGLVIHGPQESPALPLEDLVAAGRDYRETWLDPDRGSLPPPTALAPRLIQGMDESAEVLRRAAAALCWVWLASAVDTSAGGIKIRFDSTPHLEFDLTRPPLSEGIATLELWNWAVSTSDPLRREAFEQSVALAVRQASALASLASVIHRTAKFLLRLSRQGALAEALAARRATRQAAIDAGRVAAQATKASARSVLERVTTFLIGALGLLLANRADLLDPSVTGWLLGALLLLTAVAGAVALGFEFPAIERELVAFAADLNQFRETLTEDDIDQVREMRTLVTAKDELERARLLSIGLLCFALTVEYTILAVSR
jgi:hypothetical protein